MADYKDTFDMVSDVRSLLNVAQVLALLGGGKVEPSVKSTASTVKGIVVNGLSISNTADQIGYGSINVYAPPIISVVNGKNVSSPDQANLSNLAKAIKPYVDDQYSATFRMWIEDLPSILKDTDGNYFASMTYRYQSLQTNYTNI